MNDLFPHVSSHLFLSLPGFRLYAVCTILLVIKMFAVGVYTGMVRSKFKVAVNPEDAKQFGAQLVETDHPEVARVLRAHRNDLENIPAFLFLGLIAVLAGAPAVGLSICFIAFTVARFAHSVAYLKGLQPWRSMSFGIGTLSMLVLMVLIVIRLVS